MNFFLSWLSCSMSVWVSEWVGGYRCVCVVGFGVYVHNLNRLISFTFLSGSHPNIRIYTSNSSTVSRLPQKLALSSFYKVSIYQCG